jgi:RNA polymerase sigma factor (sigma-70 family)
LVVTEVSDAQLIKQSLSGSPAAWESLLSRYERLIYYVAYKSGADKDEAADVFQAVCLVWLRELGQLRDPARLGAWLVTITQRECWARWRRNRNDADSGEAQNVSTLESPEEIAGLADDARAVRDAVQQLPQP